MLDPSRSRIVLGELPLGLPHRGGIVVEDYRPTRRCPLVYRQYIISCHHAFSFRYRPQSSQPSSVSFTTRATSYPGLPRVCAAEPFPSSDYALFTSFIIHSEPNGAQHPSQESLAHADRDPRLASERWREEYRSIREISWARKRSE